MSSKLLSVIVPVYNIADHVEHLGEELAKLADLDVQVIIVDDGSDDGTAATLRGLDSPVRDLTIVENETNAGAGVARNTGFPLATGKFTLFFDGDDYLHVPEILHTIERMEQFEADVSINRYEFIRDGQEDSTGMNVVDRGLWRDFYDRYRGRTFTIANRPEFLEFTNYPWNKIIRTEPFQKLKLDPLFGKTRVHNDVLGHWNILLNAKRIILVDRTIVTHHVSGGRDHLSNKFGRERLDLFEALRSVDALLGRMPDPKRIAYPQFYWPFVRRLANWAKSRLQRSVLPEFDREVRALVQRITFEELLSIKTSGDEGTYRWLMNKIG